MWGNGCASHARASKQSKRFRPVLAYIQIAPTESVTHIKGMSSCLKILISGVYLPTSVSETKSCVFQPSDPRQSLQAWNHSMPLPGYTGLSPVSRSGSLILKKQSQWETKPQQPSSSLQ